MTTAMSGTPRITDLTVVPVAGQDSMLMNLSGAHGPWFTRNILILKDSAGHVGVGEVQGGEAIRRTCPRHSKAVALRVSQRRLRCSATVILAEDLKPHERALK